MCWYNGFSGVEYVLNIFLAMLIMIYKSYIYIYTVTTFKYTDFWIYEQVF